MEVTYRCGNGHRNKVILQGNKDAHQKAPHHLETDGTQAAPENAVCPGEVNRTMTITSPRSGPHPSRVKSVQQKQAMWKNISPLLINGKHFSIPTERKQSSCMKQKVKSQKKKISYSKGCMACISQISPQNVNHFYDANLPFERVPKSRFILTRSITQQVFINHVCFLLNLQLYMTDVISPSRSDRH